MKSSVLLLSILLIIGGILSSCDEPLPPRDDPTVVFQGKIEPEFALLSSTNALLVILKVKNVFDESLQGIALLTGNVEIAWAPFPDIRKIATLGPGNLIHARKYDVRTGLLTIDPGDSIVFLYSWNIMAESERQMRAEIFTYRTDSGCPLRKIADMETFIVRAQVRVYDKRSPANFGDTMFSFCHVDTYVDQRSCPIPRTEPPCGAR